MTGQERCEERPSNLRRPAVLNQNSPVGDAVVSVVAEGAAVGPLPGDCGSGPAAHSAPQRDAVAALARHIGDRGEELWRGCVRSGRGKCRS